MDSMPDRASDAEMTGMESVGIAGSPKMDAWMVDMLFGQSGQAKTDTPAAAAVPAVSVASGTRSAGASGTGQAIASLRAGGTDAAAEADTSDRRYMTVDQANAMIASNDAMTSAQISAVLYRGGGLQGTDLIEGPKDTFASVIQRERDGAQSYLSQAEDPNGPIGGRDPADLRIAAAEWNAHTDSMQRAFDNHTLVIQKLSDVPGLNYTGYETFSGVPDQAPTSGGWTETYDEKAMRDFMSQFTGGRHVGTPSVGGIIMLMTWTDDSLK